VVVVAVMTDDDEQVLEFDAVLHNVCLDEVANVVVVVVVDNKEDGDDEDNVVGKDNLFIFAIDRDDTLLMLPLVVFVFKVGVALVEKTLA
jgi:hypothetical protein